MITLSQISQYARTNGLGGDTDIFVILSKMQLGIKEDSLHNISNPLGFPSASKTDDSLKVEYTTQDVLDLFNS